MKVHSVRIPHLDGGETQAAETRSRRSWTEPGDCIVVGPDAPILGSEHMSSRWAHLNNHPWDAARSPRHPRLAAQLERDLLAGRLDCPMTRVKHTLLVPP